MKLRIAAFVAAALACTPVMARSHDSPPVFTEKIEQTTSSPATTEATEVTVVADTQRNAPSATTIIRFDPKYVQYAVLPAVPKQMAEFDGYPVEYAGFTNDQALAITGDLHQITNTT